MFRAVDLKGFHLCLDWDTVGYNRWKDNPRKYVDGYPNLRDTIDTFVLMRKSIFRYQHCKVCTCGIYEIYIAYGYKAALVIKSFDILWLDCVDSF